ncbi:MAG: hypothetical protein FWH04_01940 [Oscillospiraceae bacterium]|nr:hypothetical protein [Oscillospiraceae bacterium]
MINPTTQANLDKAFGDETFAKKVLAMQDLGEVQVALKTKGVDLTIEEIQQLGDAIKALVAKKQENPNAELDPEALEGIAGGMVQPTMPMQYDFGKQMPMVASNVGTIQPTW